MSWFSELTGKAGALLDKMDQAAATSLQEVGMTSPSPNKSPREPLAFHQDPNTPHPYEPTTHQSWSTPSERGAVVAQVLVGSASGSNLIRKHAKPVSSPTKTTVTEDSKSMGKQVMSDDSLFAFLNTPSKTSDRQHKTQQLIGTSHVSSKTPTIPINQTANEGSIPHPHSSPVLVQVKEKSDVTKSTVLVGEAGGKMLDQLKKEEEVEEVDEGSCEKNYPSDHSNPSPDNLSPTAQDNGLTLEKSEEKPIVPATDLEAWKQKSSNLELENKLMKREVTSLNEELVSVMSRLNEASQSTSHRENEVQALREQVSRSDHMIRQLQSHEEDLQAAVEVRDSQIQVLRTQLSSADKAVEDAKEKLDQSRKEQERLLQDANLSSEAQSQALASLQGQFSQIQSQLEREREEHRAEKTSFIERESLLQSEKAQLLSSLTASQKQVAAEQNRKRECQTALQNVQREAQILKKEHEEYRQRATAILQAKEKLINGLQCNEGGRGEANEARLEDAQLEKEHLQAQLSSALQQVESIRNDMQELEEKSRSEMEGMLEQVRVCEGVLADERTQHASCKDDLARLTLELQMIREDLDRERTAHREDLNAKEVEYANLKHQFISVTPGKAELEARLHELTDSLIEKQTTLEALNSERNSLNVQLQRLQRELAEGHKPTTASLHTAVNVLEPPAPASKSAHVRTMTSVIPSLDRAASNSRLHKVRRAVNTVDRISIRLGTFLKRYPHARLLALVYMLILHLWVMVVLLTYSPEIHNSSPGP